jgi:hypothetical protein
MDDPTPLDFLRAVYLNSELPLSVRMKAAIEAAPYVHPKLSVAANIDPVEFSKSLDKAIQRSGVRLIAGGRSAIVGNDDDNK